jgi:alpha-L-arabinofuranosidase
LTLTVTNRHIARPVAAGIVVRGASIRSSRATTLLSGDVHDHNTFDRPAVVRPQTANVTLAGPVPVYEFPAASVTRLDIELA